MDRFLETEVDVSVEKESYILTGKIDLLLGKDDKLELLDFKSQPRPFNDDSRLKSYYNQLCTYGHILERRYGKRAERLLLYWTRETRKEDALMAFSYRPEIVDQAGIYFDGVVEKILRKDFEMRKIPERRVCKECDLQPFCSRKGAFKSNEKEV